MRAGQASGVCWRCGFWDVGHDWILASYKLYPIYKIGHEGDLSVVGSTLPARPRLRLRRCLLGARVTGSEC